MRPSRLARSRLRTGVPVRFLLVAGLATVVMVGVGVLALGGSDEEPEPEPEEEAPFRTTALADYDTSGAVVSRGQFCDAIDMREVRAALGGEPAPVRSWEPGDRVELPSGGQDVVHEFGCEYAGADGATASAWVFASPVEAARARRLVKETREIGWCARREGATFGDPSLSLGCLGTEEVSHSYLGLFGDAWLTCQVSIRAPADLEPPDPIDLQDRTGRWCVGVLRAASGRDD